MSRPPYPADTLLGNLQAFCTLLRREHDFVAGPGEVALAVQAVELVGAGQPERVYTALQAVLCQDARQLPVFRQAFERFFFPGPHATRQDSQPPLNMGHGDPPVQAAPSPTARPQAAAPARRPAGPAPDEDQPDLPPAVSAAARHADHDDAAQTPQAQPVRAVASAQARTGAGPALDPTPPGPLRQAARTFLRQLRLGHARRWQAAVQGARLDLRRTLRASLGTGGEAATLHWRRPPHRRPRVVLLIDASRSMQQHAEEALAFGAALRQCSAHVHVFAFSAEVQDLTGLLETGRVPALAAAWGGGTRIGGSLDQFLRQHAGRVLGRDTLAVVVSDGLDMGDVALLARSVAELRRRSAGVLWLNPLAAHPAYQPTARGMQAALPYLTRLTHASTPEQFAGLTRHLPLA